MEAYRNHSGDVRKNVEWVKAGLVRVTTHEPWQEPLTDELLNDGVKDLESFFDPVHGGFGDGPKFPNVPPLSLLLRQR